MGLDKGLEFQMDFLMKSDWRLVIVGPWARKLSLQAFCQEHNLLNVYFMG